MKVISLIINICEIIGFSIFLLLFLTLVFGEITLTDTKTGEIVYQNVKDDSTGVDK